MESKLDTKLSTRKSKMLLTALTMVAISMAAPRVKADDTEIFFGNSANAASPNILLVLDTSGSMHEEVDGTPNPYDPNTTSYSGGSCDRNYVYYSSTGTPDCTTGAKVAKSDFTCSIATDVFKSTAVGKYSGAHFARWIQKTVKVTTGSGINKVTTTTVTYAWNTNFNPSGGTGTTWAPKNQITCAEDTDSSYPSLGDNSSSGDLWKGSSASNFFTGIAGTVYTVYDGNYLAYLNDPTQQGKSTRMAVVKKAAKDLIDSLVNSPVNVGIMRYSANANTTNGGGGMVVAAVQDVTAGAANLKQAIDDMHYGGYTPLSETLHEAYLYYAGAAPKYGDSSTRCKADDPDTCSSTQQETFKSVGDSRSGSVYKSPIASACQSNYIVFLTDGLANGDYHSDSSIEGLDTSSTGCYSSASNMWKALGYSTTPSGTSGGVCLKEMSRVLYTKDLNTGSTFPGTQNVTTYFIGFGNDVANGAAQTYLADAAKAGGGTAEIATNATELASKFEKVVAEMLNTSATFNSPSVAVNSFNKTQVLEDMYVAMFEPSKTLHWPGNLKKFKLRDGMIVGQDTAVNAVNPATGFFTNTVEDFWQQSTDTGTDITTRGGAAMRIPDPTSRNLYTYIGTNRPSSLQSLKSHQITTSNLEITGTLLGTSATTPSRGILINWARGDSDGSTTTTNDALHQMGDPIHSQPSVVIYGNTGSTTVDKLNDAVTFVATNDGYLHAIDVSNGAELWSYIPQELLGDIKNLYANAATTTKHYSLDGDIRILKYDVKGDGVVTKSEGDRVFLYVSQGRGGDHYYALDITVKDDPQFMWSLSNGDLNGIVSKSWSAPSLARVKVGDGSAQNSQKLVLIFGGGYDDAEDAQGYLTADTYGNGLFMIDAVKGTLLWSKTKESTGAFTNMTHAIPSNVAVIDTDNDGWADRMYVGDMAGQLWRFDITNGNDATTLVAGGVIASLGGKVSATTANNRSFYNTPDIARFNVKGGPNFYNIAIGSGDRAYPRSNTTTQDRFYSLRDYAIGPLTQSAYDAYTAIHDSDLTTADGSTILTLAGNSPGWKLVLSAGEKVLSQSITVDGAVMFTTYVPASVANSCSVSAGSGRSYAVNVSSGVKRFDDLYETFASTGLPPAITILNENQVIRTTTDGGSDSGGGTDGSSGGGSSGGGGGGSSGGKDSTCFTGVTHLNKCVNLQERVKTFWRDAGAM